MGNAENLFEQNYSAQKVKTNSVKQEISDSLSDDSGIAQWATQSKTTFLQSARNN